MMRNSRKKKATIISIALVVLMMFSTVASAAKVFTDVPDSHWAKEFIEKMNEAGVITGYDDATFKPSENVTKIQAVVMIARLLGVDKSEVDREKTKYRDFFNEISLKSWYEDGVTVALSRGIVSKDVVKTFFDNGTEKVANKSEICIYLTRAMGLEAKAKEKSYIVLPFKDSELIPPTAAAYVDIMIEQGIINKAGDANGKFNPSEAMNRAMMAKVLSVAYEYIQDNGGADEVSTPVINDEKTVSVTGTISNVLRATNELYLTVENKKGDKAAYRVTEASSLKLDGKKITMDKLAEGLTIEAEVTENLSVVSLEAESITEEYEGEVRSISLSSTPMITIEYEEDDDTEREGFYVDDDAEITINGKSNYVRNIEDGDLIEIKVVNGRIVKADVDSKYKDIEGIIKEVKFSPEPMLVIEDEDEVIYSLEISSKAKIYRNDKRVQVTELKAGDEVEVETEYNIITDIEAEVVEKEDEGTIESILIASRPEITITNSDGDEVTYYISNNADIKLDKKRETLYGLRLGYFVELEIEGNEIVVMDAVAREKSDRYEGTIEYINEKANIIVISTINSSGEKQSVTIYIDEDDTNYIDPDGKSTKLRYLEEGDEILAMGAFDGVIFTAKTIIVTEYNY